MDLILCHTTADFDTLGAAVGLTRLRPGSRIVLTGGTHPAVGQFLALHRDEYPLIERRSVNAQLIRSLVVVDTQRRSRLGKVAEWLDQPHVDISIYDHHQDADSDIAAARLEVEPVGATTTLVAERLQAQHITLNPVEATVMALGIHVDTGSLTFDHSTPRDAHALAWLMEQGASLRAIADYIDPGLSPNLQQVLTTALDDLQTEIIQGMTLGWVLLQLDEFTPGLSSVASRLVELTNLDALILAAQYCKGDCEPDETGDRSALTLIGRSRIDGTDLNALFQPLGGGGHPRAVSANLHHVVASDIVNQVVQQLKAQLPQPPSARELMSSPVRTIRPDITIDEAQRILLRYGHSGLSVVDANGQLVGIISRRDLDIALRHGFSHAPVKGYMTTNLKTITPTTLLPEIEDLMVTYDIGRLPVLARGDLVGIVTRTDLLRQLHRADRSHQEPQTAGTSLPSRSAAVVSLRSPQVLLDKLRRCLKPHLWQLLMTAAAQAEQRGWQLYVVGGAVRDLLLALLRAPNQSFQELELQDIDLVVDGFHQTADAAAGVELARSLRDLHPQARLDVHGKFQTAALLWHNDPTFQSLWIDIATARTEFYPYPAANPEVEASSIRQDLYRRDFTINALAIRLTSPRMGELLDFFGGVLDLQAQQIRVLHANSFIEDPTRIYRAVRFAVRLGFTIDSQTEAYIHHAIASGIYHSLHHPHDGSKRRTPALQTRLRAELQSVLEAPYWKPALRCLAELNALQCVHPTLHMDRILWRQLCLSDRGLHRLQRLGTPLPPQLVPASPWLLRLEVVLAYLDPAYRAQVAENLQLPADSIARLQSLAIDEATINQHLPPCGQPSQIVQVLRPYDGYTLGLIAARNSRSVRKAIWRYLTEWSMVKPPLTGTDLKQMGYRAGPQFRQILDALTAATLDGQVCDRATATTFVTTHFPDAQRAQTPNSSHH